MKNLMIPALALFFIGGGASRRQSVMDALLCDLPGRADDRVFLPRGYLHGPFFRRESPAVDNTSGS